MADISKLLPITLTLQRRERTSDGKGGFVETFSTVASLSARISALTAKDTTIAHQQQAQVSHAIYLVPGNDVRMNDQIVFNAFVCRVVVPNVEPWNPVYQKVLVKELIH